jgi:uncharacterized protein (TIGR00299 family) protein
MKILFIDGQAGAAGDMILGALVDLGVDPNTLKNALRPIVPSDFELHIERVSPNGIAATQLTVKTGEDIKHRHLSQILELLAKGSLSQGVRGRVEGVFRRLAAAEAKIHSSTIDNVHFHEVGANDAIIDIVGAIWALEALSIERVFCAPLVLGSGVGTSVHGAIHYPAPAVLEILRGIPVRHVADVGETTTPTGAAILAEVAQFTTDCTFIPERVGYGAGTKTLPDRPNLLRATLGEMSASFDSDTLWLGTSDIDNTRPEVFEWVEERLRAAGAIEVVTLATAMKKGRQGTRIEVLCDAAHRSVMAEIITSETASLGVRWHEVTRTKLERRIETVQTPWGPIRVKVASMSAGERAVPEYDDCRDAASKHCVPLIEIIDRTARLYYDQHPGHDTKRG